MRPAPCGARHAHHQTEIGDQAVVGAHHRRTQGVAADAPVSAFPAGDRTAGGAGGLLRHGVDDFGMTALGGRQSRGDGLGLAVVLRAAAFFERVEGGQNETVAEPARQKRQHATAKARLCGRNLRAYPAEVVAPEGGMGILHLRKPKEDFAFLPIGFALCQCPIEKGAVDFVPKIFPIATGVFPRHAFVHFSPHELAGMPARGGKINKPGVGR
jgi:hypothetical protein